MGQGSEHVAVAWAAIAALRPDVYRFVRRMTHAHEEAEDLTQRALLDAFRASDKFMGQSSLATWVKGVALNTVRHAQRSVRRRREEALDEESFGATPDPDAPAVDAVVIARAELKAVNTAMADLPTDYRAVIVAVCIEEMSYEEAAACLGVPVGTVRSRLSRARAALCQKLGRGSQS